MFSRKSVTKVYDSMLLALGGGGWVTGVKFPGKKCDVTLEWPLCLNTVQQYLYE